MTENVGNKAAREHTRRFRFALFVFTAASTALFFAWCAACRTALCFCMVCAPAARLTRLKGGNYAIYPACPLVWAGVLLVRSAFVPFASPRYGFSLRCITRHCFLSFSLAAPPHGIFLHGLTNAARPMFSHGLTNAAARLMLFASELPSSLCGER